MTLPILYQLLRIESHKDKLLTYITMFFIHKEFKNISSFRAECIFKRVRWQYIKTNIIDSELPCFRCRLILVQ